MDKTTLIQGCSIEYGVTISTKVKDWVDDDGMTDTPIIGIRFQLGKDEWTDRFVMPVFGGTAMMSSLIHQMVDAGHEDLALELFREAANKEEQSSILTLLTSKTSKSDYYREMTFPENEPTLDLIRASTAIIQQTINDDRDSVAQSVATVDEAGGLPAVTRFIALMAGRSIGYISLLTEMSPETVMNILAGSALFEAENGDDIN
jgi:hypothetical protein